MRPWWIDEAYGYGTVGAPQRVEGGWLGSVEGGMGRIHIPYQKYLIKNSGRNPLGVDVFLLAP